MKGGVCKRHGAKKKTCRHEGCSKYAQKGGVCIRHGAVLKKCSHEGYAATKYRMEDFVLNMVPREPEKLVGMKDATIRGVCKRHGALPKAVCVYR